MLGARGFVRRFSHSRIVLEKTPFQVFINTFRTELKKSKELQTNIKALQDETGRLSESTAFKRAKEALEKSREARSATSKGFHKAGEAVGTAASATWNSAPIKLTRSAISNAADVVDKASAPIRETSAFKEVKNVIDDGASIGYGGFETREQRRKRRELELERQKKLFGARQNVKANGAAGDNLVVHETAKPDAPQGESSVRKTIEKWRLAYEESDNALVTAVRSVTDVIGSLFGETEQARVVKALKIMDPHFSQDAFLREMRAYILPEVLDAYVRGDGSTLQKWLSEASFNVWNQITKEYRDKGLYAAGRVLDVRGVDIVQAKLRQPDNQPMYVIACRAQETNYYKSLKTEKVAAGVPDQVLLSPYVMVITRIAEDMDNDETHGWKILEFVRGKSSEYT